MIWLIRVVTSLCQMISPTRSRRIKSAGCEIVTGNMIPPDFATFWAQSAQQGFAPKVVTIGKALLFPSVIESLGERGDGCHPKCGGHRTSVQFFANLVRRPKNWLM